MAPDNGTNIPHNTDFEPLLTVDSTVEVQPDNDVYAVDVLEVLPQIETQEFTVPANGTLDEEELRSLYVQDGVLAQYRLPDPVGGGANAMPDGVRITVDQGGEEAPRFNNKNSRGFLTNETPRYGDSAQQTELFQFEDTDLFFNVENTTGAEETFTLIFTGWAYKLSGTQMEPGDADQAVLTERSSLRR